MRRTALIALVFLSLALAPTGDARAQEPVRIGEISRWEDVPAALVRSYRRARLVQSSLSLATGTVGAVGGALELTGSSGSTPPTTPCSALCCSPAVSAR